VAGSEELVEAGHEFGVVVTHQEPDLFVVVGQGAGQVAGLLGDPVAAWVGGDTCEPDPSMFEFDEEQDIEPMESDGFHGGCHPGCW
jgi:hypothetical protein